MQWSPLLISGEQDRRAASGGFTNQLSYTERSKHRKERELKTPSEHGFHTEAQTPWWSQQRPQNLDVHFIHPGDRLYPAAASHASRPLTCCGWLAVSSQPLEQVRHSPHSASDRPSSPHPRDLATQAKRIWMTRRGKPGWHPGENTDETGQTGNLENWPVGGTGERSLDLRCSSWRTL